MALHYGLISIDQAFELAHRVCDVLGYGSTGSAAVFLLEIAATETHLGEYQDPTLLAGMGLNQFDEKPFEYIKATARDKHKALIRDHFGIDVDAVHWQELRHNPLLSFIWCRLFWLKRKELIPKTRELRAALWKRLYNTAAGKGTVEQYLSKSQRYINERSVKNRTIKCGLCLRYYRAERL